MTSTSAVDVIVVGAGIAGASAAAELSTTRTVLLIERERLPAQHASGRSASVLSETSGHPVVCALARLSRAFFESPPPGFAQHALLRPRGLVWVGEQGDATLLDELAATAARVAHGSRRLTPSEVHELLPSFADAAIAGGGVHEPEAMAIDAAAVIDGCAIIPDSASVSSTSRTSRSAPAAAGNTSRTSAIIASVSCSPSQHSHTSAAVAFSVRTCFRQPL